MIPLFRPSCSDLEIRYVTEALRSGWWGLGPKTAEFERRFAAYAGVAHAAGVNSCTSALQLTLEALGVRGGEVIVPSLTFASTALAVVHAGARPVFADVDDDSLCLDWADVVRRVTLSTRAVVPVWYGGTVVAPPRWARIILAARNAPIVEDCAHAAGSAHAGRLGLAACWSFHAVKNLAAGDGGMVTTPDPDLVAKVRELRWCGISKTTWDRDTGGYGWEYDIRSAGHKMHMNDITAALGLAQLERLDDLNKARRAAVCRYLDDLALLGWVRLPAWRETSAWHLFPVRVPAARRPGLVAHLLDNGVAAGVHYKPLHLFETFRAGRGRLPLPVTETAWQELVTLPLYPDMTETDQARVTGAVQTFTR